MRKIAKPLAVAVVATILTIPTLASPVEAVTCFDNTGQVQGCPPVGYTECHDQYGAVSCDPCAMDKFHAVWDARQPLFDQILTLKVRIHAQSELLLERRAKIWFLHRKIARQRAEIRQLRAQFAAAISS